MHVLYVHQNFPAQFGHLAQRLAAQSDWRCTFISQVPATRPGNINRIAYTLRGGATRYTHFCARTFENATWHCQGVFDALRQRPDVRPDLIVGHSGFGSTLFLRELYPDVPLINLFEYFYRPHDRECDMDFRRDLGWTWAPQHYHRARARNAMILLDLNNCDCGYTPTHYQHRRFPDQYQSKLDVVFDGIDRTLYHGGDETLRPPPDRRGPRTVAGIELPASTRLITYVSRGFESMRGFDIFMRAGQLIARQFPDVHFIVVGEDRIAYGGDADQIAPAKTFKEWVLSRDDYDLSRFSFVGRLPPGELARLLAATDLHIYLTVPFVLSWSMLDAMSCGAVVLASNTAPVAEMVRDGQNGLLADFFDAEEFANKALEVLRDPAAYRPLGRAAERLMDEHYSLDVILPRMIALYERAAAGGTI